MKLSDHLTAAGLGPPVLQCDVAFQAAGLGVSLQKLAVEAVHLWVFAQSVCAGGYVGLWVSVVVASGEGSLHHEITAVPAVQRGRTRVNDQLSEQYVVCLASRIIPAHMTVSYQCLIKMTRSCFKDERSV